MIDIVEVGQRAAAAWLRPEESGVDEWQERQTAAAGAQWLDREDPGWAQRRDPSPEPRHLADRCIEQAPKLDRTRLIGAWMWEIALRRSQ